MEYWFPSLFPSTPEPPPPKPPPPKPPAFLDEPWRQIEGWDKSTRKEMRSKIVDLKPEQFDVQTFNIILTGQIGAGKSCFYNSINSALSGCIRPFTAASGKTGQSFTKEFNMYPFRHNPNIRIGDIMGMDVNGSDVDIRNILKVVDGHVLNGYQFHSGEEFKSTDNPKYIPCPSLAERPHCVGLVINAHDFSNILGAQERNLHRLSKAIIDRGIPLVVVLTHLDEFHPEIEADVARTFRSRSLKDLMGKISNVVHGIPENQIFPVFNYHKEVLTVVEKDVLLLYALDFMINAAESYLEKQGRNALSRACMIKKRTSIQ